MADYSHVTVVTTATLEYGKAEALGLHIARKLGWTPSRWGPPFDVSGAPGDADCSLRFEIEEARWGSEDEEVDQITEILTERNVGWTVFDSAHWSWTTHEIAWRPGMAEPKRREWTHSDGAPALDPYTFAQLREKLEVDDIGGRPWCLSLVEAIEGHFSDDPERWL